jgi:hypothetical protein
MGVQSIDDAAERREQAQHTVVSTLDIVISRHGVTAVELLDWAEGIRV